MPGVLRCETLNVNDPAMVQHLVEALTELAAIGRHPLMVSGIYHFSVPTGSISTFPGWYVICEQDWQPLYVGTAKNLDARLNSDQGSRDSFADPKRTSDPVRNFIKSYSTKGILSSLSVITIPEPELCKRIGVQSPLPKRDRENIEKVLDVFRSRILAQCQSIAQHRGSASLPAG